MPTMPASPHLVSDPLELLLWQGKMEYNVALYSQGLDTMDSQVCLDAPEDMSWGRHRSSSWLPVGSMFSSVVLADVCRDLGRILLWRDSVMDPSPYPSPDVSSAEKEEEFDLAEESMELSDGSDQGSESASLMEQPQLG